MQRTITGFLLAPIIALAITYSAIAEELTSDYLHGNWAPGGSEFCGDINTEQLSFAPDGTFMAKRFGVTDAIGYWRQQDDVLQLHLLTSPAHYDKALKQFQGRFEYFLIRVVVISAEPDELKVFGLIGHQVRKETLTRCGG